MTTRLARAVVVTRPTEYDELLARHGTRGQAEFFLATRGRSLEELEERHQRQEAALRTVLGDIPPSWRRTRVAREDLDRFLFQPDDVVIAVGQDGLVANVAKYLDGQPVVGVNPDPGFYEGVLVRHAAPLAGDLVVAAAALSTPFEERTMVEVELDDGQRLVALNEVFLGHRTHQSARYRLEWRDRAERQSSSGIIVSTGTGATGWARSVHRQRTTEVVLPSPDERRIVFFTREAWPSVASGASVTDGDVVEGDELVVLSEMERDGVVFGDGIEADSLPFTWGRRVSVRVSSRRLRLVAG